MAKNPHMSLRPVDHPGENRRWRCVYCGDVGPLKDLRSRACSHVYEPCEHCGQAPECALDCPGIVAVLSGDRVAVVGDMPVETRAAVAEYKRKRGRS